MTPKIWLELANIDVIKSDKYLLQDLNLKLYEGEIITILGPNGSGKSSFVKLINRSLYPVIKKHSKIKLFDKELINIWELRSKISYVNNELHERINHKISVHDLINSGMYGTIGLHQRQSMSSLDFQKTESILDQFGLINHKDKTYQELSDGQKRTALIARAMINNPKVLILDEPTINLDMKSYYNLFQVLRQLVLAKITIVIVTNKIESILKETTRIIFIKSGKLFMDGTPAQILTSENINNLFDTKLELINVKGNWKIIPKN